MTSNEADAFYALVHEKRGLIKLIGMVLIILGIAAIASPHVVSVATEKLIGWILLASGAINILQVVLAKAKNGFVWQIIIGTLQASAGAWLLIFPEGSAITLTVLLSMIFIGEGIVRSFSAFSLQPRPAWKWVLLSGLVSLIIGVLTFVNMPSSADWAIGLLVGCNIAMAGWILVVIASSVEKH